jgi:hypothetical protein
MLLLLSSLAILLTSASAEPPGKPEQAPAPKLKSDPAAVEALKQAVEHLDMKRHGPVKTDLWQEVDVQGLAFQAQGTYLAASGQRLRLELRINRIAGTSADTKVISDGKVLWEISEIGTQGPSVARVDLKRVLEEMDSPDKLKTRESFLQSQSFAGLTPLLDNLKMHITFTALEDTTWKGRKVKRLTGTWSDAPPIDTKDWAEFMPRQCTLYLDAETYWPHRLEWWGPTVRGEPRSKDALLMQLEFRNGQRPKEQDLAGGDFTYDPRSATVTDKTDEWVSRAKDLVRREGAK